MTKISDAETAALSGANMKDFSRKASTNEDPPHHETYTDIKPHQNAFSSPGLAADVLHDHSGVLAEAPPAQHHPPMNESVGMHHVKWGRKVTRYDECGKREQYAESERDPCWVMTRRVWKGVSARQASELMLN